jgi:hypothetical protein
MSATHHDRSISPYDFGALPEPNIFGDQSSRRRRVESSVDLEDNPPRPAQRFAGDGLDFRRPITSGSLAARREARGVNTSGGNTQATAIDLTDEDGPEDSQASDLSAPGPSAVRTSRAQRLPRFGRNLLDLDTPTELEEDADEVSTARLPGASYLALPPRHHATSSQPSSRPQFGALRRPTRPPSPPTAMDEDEIEFVTERPRASRQNSDAPHAPRLHLRLSAPRSITPHPTGIMNNNFIDLTDENDDDVVLVNARQREGVNNVNGTNVAAPQLPAVAGLNFGHFGHIAQLVREGGINYGGRLYRHIQAGFGLDGMTDEARAAQERARDRMEDHERQNGLGAFDAVARAVRADRERHRHVAPRPRALARGLPGMMDYGAPAFDLGLPGGHRPPTPKYSPPPSPGPGFTRSPAENEAVVCPNCGDELALGDGDTKQEVWLVKGCGHVSFILNKSTNVACDDADSSVSPGLLRRMRPRQC